MSARAQRYTQRQRLQAVSAQPPPNNAASDIDFRSRLRSVGATDEARQSEPLEPDSDSNTTPRLLVQQLEAAFALLPSPQPTVGPLSSAPKKDARLSIAADPFNKLSGKILVDSSSAGSDLADVFTQAGCAIYSAAVDELAKSHSVTEKRIGDYRKAFSTILKANDELYSNIEWPLSRTQCSLEGRPTASVDVHLKKLSKKLKLAETKLRALAQEWDTCIVAESKAWHELEDSTEPNRDSELRGSSGSNSIFEFKRRAQNVAKVCCEQIDEIDEVREHMCFFQETFEC